MKYAEYSANGQIQMIGITSDPDSLRPPAEGVERIELDPETEIGLITHYLHDGIITPRPEMGLTIGSNSVQADGVSTFTVLGIPEATRVEIDGPISDEWLDDSGEVAITVNVPGTYTVLLECFPYQSVKAKFDAT